LMPNAVNSLSRQISPISPCSISVLMLLVRF
jgi:hypothetical protein